MAGGTVSVCLSGGERGSAPPVYHWLRCEKKWKYTNTHIFFVFTLWIMILIKYNDNNKNHDNNNTNKYKLEHIYIYKCVCMHRTYPVILVVQSLYFPLLLPPPPLSHLLKHHQLNHTDYFSISPSLFSWPIKAILQHTVLPRDCNNQKYQLSTPYLWHFLGSQRPGGTTNFWAFQRDVVIHNSNSVKVHLQKGRTLASIHMKPKSLLTLRCTEDHVQKQLHHSCN